MTLYIIPPPLGRRILRNICTKSVISSDAGPPISKIDRPLIVQLSRNGNLENAAKDLLPGNFKDIRWKHFYLDTTGT